MSDKPRYRVKARRKFLSLVESQPLEGEDAPNVVVLPVVTKLNLPADRILKAAIGELTEVVVIGYTKDGEEWFASSVAGGDAALWHLERAKFKLLNLVERFHSEAPYDAGA